MNASPRACPLSLGTGPGWCLFTSSHIHGGSPGDPLDLLWGILRQCSLHPMQHPALFGFSVHLGGKGQQPDLQQPT